MVRVLCLALLVGVVSVPVASAQVTLSWKWREGDTFWVQVQSDRKARSHALADKKDAKPIDFTNEVKRTNVSKWQVLQLLPDGKVVLDVSFEQIAWKSNGPLQEDPLQPLEGQSIQITLDRQGKVASLSGVDVLVQRMSLDRPPEIRAKLIDFVKANLTSWVESVHVPLPLTPVQTGGQWQEEHVGEETIQGKWKHVSTYRYQGTQPHNGKTLHGITVKVDSTLTPPAQPKTVGNVRWNKTTIIKDEGAGHVWFDNEKGRPVQVTGTVHTEYTGDLTENDLKVTGGNDLLATVTTTFYERSPFADKLLPRQPFDPLERLKQEPVSLSRQIVTSLGQQFNLIPRGSFVMGSPRTEAGRYGNELEHNVVISKPFYIGVHEVTVAQFRRFVTETGYRTEAEQHYFGGHGFDAASKEMVNDARFNWKNTGFDQGDNHPVVNVTWNDAVKFCEWLSAREKRKYRLPTEAEWEYACRAGTTTRYCYGEDTRTLVKFANCADEGSVKALFPSFETVPGNDGALFTAPVGKYKANGWGLHDMSGNVLEWCSDWLGEVNVKDTKDPQGPQSGTVKVMKGGSWPDFASDLRVARRSGFPPNCRYSTTGFRLVLEP